MVIFFPKSDSLFFKWEFIKEDFIVSFVELIHAWKLSGKSFENELCFNLYYVIYTSFPAFDSS